ncbi:MAG: ANTAR domain-containing protein [Gammaproteobacteria bacterium]|nr:ANTAR domain-containing protein [Gammaproteobacteria bacterium]MBL6999733.1 ANTAR domain-containing protein [Gammaproteobacteria bacterium]
MLIDESTDRSQSMAQKLQQANCDVVFSQTSAQQDLLEQIAQLEPDIIIIDIDLPDRDTLENLRCVQAAAPRPMVMFSQDDDGATIRRAVQAGVSAYIVDGVQSQRVRPILDAAIATFDQYSELQSELDQTRLQLVERKTIERAKGILMKQRQIEEAEAYQLMRKTAMNQKKKLIDIASSIIYAAELLLKP